MNNKISDNLNNELDQFWIGVGILDCEIPKQFGKLNEETEELHQAMIEYDINLEKENYDAMFTDLLMDSIKNELADVYITKRNIELLCLYKSYVLVPIQEQMFRNVADHIDKVIRKYDLNLEECVKNKFEIIKQRDLYVEDGLIKKRG